MAMAMKGYVTEIESEVCYDPARRGNISPWETNLDIPNVRKALKISWYNVPKPRIYILAGSVTDTLQWSLTFV